MSLLNEKTNAKSGQVTAISSYVYKAPKDKTFDSFQNYHGESISGSPTPVRLGPINNPQIAEVQPFDDDFQKASGLNGI